MSPQNSTVRIAPIGLKFKISGSLAIRTERRWYTLFDTDYVIHRLYLERPAHIRFQKKALLINGIGLPNPVNLPNQKAAV